MLLVHAMGHRGQGIAPKPDNDARQNGDARLAEVIPVREERVKDERIAEIAVHNVRFLTACAMIWVVCVASVRDAAAWNPSESGNSVRSGISGHRSGGKTRYSSNDFPTLPALPGSPTLPMPPGLENETKSNGSGAHPDAAGVRDGTGVYEGMVLIPAGPFEMGSPPGTGRVNERPAHKVFLKTFYIAKHEVTAREYCRFLNEQGLKAKDGLPRVNLASPHCTIEMSGKSFRPVKGMDDYPVVCVSWYGAMDYARWAGGRLPTAAEWEKAALLTTPQPPGDFLTVLTRETSVPVQIAAPAIRGVTGLIGNVWEWTFDWFAEDYYAQSRASNPTGPPLGREKEIRGGSWASSEASKRIPNRHKAPPQGYFRTVGFRIVKD